MKKSVIHFTENYGATGETYICDQVNLLTRYQGQLLAERRLPTSYNPVPNTQYYSEAPRSAWLNRILNAARKRFYAELYETQLNQFYFKKLESMHPQILHAHFGPTGCRVIALKQKFNKPLVVTFYGNDISEVLKSPVWVKRYQDLFKFADRLVVLLDEGVDRLVRIGCPREKIVVWDIGIPIDEYPYRLPHFADAEKTILTTARFVEKKGYPYLLEAFQRVIQSYPSLKLKILGNGPLKEKILSQIDELKITDKVELTDTSGRSDFFDLFKQHLKSSHYFVLPSIVAPNGDDEGGPPVVLTNAMASGLPIVSTAIGGITRAIEDGKTGLICKSGDANDLTKKIIFLLENPEIAQSLSRNARIKAEQFFDQKRQIAKLENIYDELTVKSAG